MRRLSRLFIYIIISLAFFLGIVYVPSLSDEDFLPQIEYFTAFELEDNLEGMLESEINEIRTLYGLPILSFSKYLKDSSLYRAIYLSQYGLDNIGDSFVEGPLDGQEIGEVFPYLDYEEIIYLDNPLYGDDYSLANYILKLLENKKTDNYLLNNRVVHLGLSVITYDDYALCLIHWSESQEILETENRVPEKILKDDTIPPRIFLTDIYVAKDDILSDELIVDSIRYEDNSRRECTISFDKSDINTSLIGEYSLHVSAEDESANIGEGYLNIYVVPRIYPTIPDDEIIIPILDFRDLYEIGNYILVLDSIGIKEIRTNPSFCTIEDDGIIVEVKAINKAGLETIKEMKIVFTEIEHYLSPKAKAYPLYPQEGEPLSKEMIIASISSYDEDVSIIVDQESFEAIDLDKQGTYLCKVHIVDADTKSILAVPVHVKEKPKAIREDFPIGLDFDYYKLSKEGLVESYDHIVFDIGEEIEEGNLVAFSFSLYGKETYTIVRPDKALVWNPTSSGLYDIRISILDGESRKEIKSSQMSLFVEEKAYLSNTIPYMVLNEDSNLIVNSKDRIINNIRPGNGFDIGTSLAELIDNFSIVDYNLTGPVLRAYNINGQILEEEDLLGNGSIIELVKDDDLFERYTILIYGDLNGDGNINLADYSYLRQHILGRVEIDGIRFKAANIAERDKDAINLGDYSMLRQYILGRYEISQS